ncbi:MAG TPA: hypothetical protein G4N95_00135 [Anaerolineae bacterium]|nr:hypothetical protein [Anaerolineae bacterium]
MRSKQSFSGLQWLSAFLLLAAIILLALQLVKYSRLRASFPQGMSIAGVPVSGLDRQQAAQRILEAYNVPVELHYGENVIQMNPAIIGFELDLESMLAAADLERTRQSFWLGFWDYLWGRSIEPINIPLRSSYSESRLRSYLQNEITTRYDKPPTPASPIVGTVNFQPGTLGTSLDIDQSIIPIENALHSINHRIVNLSLKRTLPPRPSFQNLEILLKQTIEISGFDGTLGLYLLDLQTAQEIHFGLNSGVEISVNPDIAFTTASIIKIPIVVSTFKRLDEEPDTETANLIEKMIIESGNEAADWLMERVIDPSRAPLLVTEDMRALGLESTFLAGHFYQGAPLLAVVKTPANQRTDINTSPDLYNQTTPSDMGMLLEDIYQCAQTGGGTLTAVFPGQINQTECQIIISYLSRNKIGNLIEAGVPETTQIAHKHGWVSNNGIINLIGDAAIVYTPGGNYIFVIFLHHPVQLLWDPSAKLIVDLSRAIYNFYNLPTQ